MHKAHDSAFYYALLALGCLVIFLTNNVPNHLRNMRLAGREESLLAEIKEYRSANDGLRLEIRALETDPYLIEKSLREELRLLRPGELPLDRVKPPKPRKADPKSSLPGRR